MPIYGNQILQEINTVKDLNSNMCIGLFDGFTYRGLDKDPYFKVYNSADPTKATKLARIRFSRPEYVTGHTTGPDAGKKEWILNSSEKKKLIKLLNANWVQLNKDLSVVIRKDVFYQMPDYSKL